jgi:hypothetical protein
MISYDLDREFGEEGYPGLAIAANFHSVERYLSLLTKYVPIIKDDFNIHFLEGLANIEQLESEEHKEQLGILKWETEMFVPRCFYGASILALWAAFESSVSQLAAFIKLKASVRLSFEEIREQNLVRRLQLYVETFTSKPVYFGDAIVKGISDLQMVRNSLAHSNGDLHFLSAEKRNRLEVLVSTQIGLAIIEDELIVREQYARTAFVFAENFVNTIMVHVHSTYPFPSSKA